MNGEYIEGGGDISKHNDWRTCHGGRLGSHHAFATRGCHRRAQPCAHRRVSGEQS